MDPPPPPAVQRRSYAEWYAWALPNLGGDDQRDHAAAAAAITVLSGGGATDAAAAAARQAAAAPPPADSVDPVILEQRVYAQAYVAVLARGVLPQQAHQTVEAALERGSVKVKTRVIGQGRRSVRRWLPGAAVAGAITLLAGLLGGLLALAGYAISIRLWRSSLETWLKVILILATAVVGAGLYVVGVTVLAFMTGK